MNQVIDGKVYDTTKADHVCDISSPTRDRRDFGWHETQLYRTAKGRFFVAGEGGPRSMWAESVGQNGSRGGSGMHAISDHEARTYMESAGCSADEFIEAGLPLEEA